MDHKDALMAKANAVRASRKLFRYKPYDWQKALHNSTARERMAMAANRSGKTFSAACEVAIHATGDYPDWWEGVRFEEAPLIWVGSITVESSRDITQKELLGGLGEDLGTGAIPKASIIGKPDMRQAGVKGVVDTVKVRHKSGGISKIVFKSYDQGWAKWQGTAPHLVWLDEEPEDYRIFTECETRILSSRGSLIVTFTPLHGETDLVLHFTADLPGTFMVNATWEDAPHLDKDAREELAALYPDYELEARTKGIPMMGEGRVWKTVEEDIKISPIEIPTHWARLKGIDFGIDHPAAVADIAWDRDGGVVYVTRTWKKSGADAAEHAAAINEGDQWVPVSWPHDGTTRDKGSGNRLIDTYRSYGVKALSMSARYSNDKGGGQPVEPIVLELDDMMKTGAFKVFDTCHDFFSEYRSYHRKDGKIVARRDDVIKAVMYAVMMRRYALPGRIKKPQPAYRRPAFSTRVA